MAAFRILVALAVTVGGASSGRAAIPGCDGTLLTPESRPRPSRDITSADLVRLRDIGPSIGYPERQSPFSVSPDGRHAAFQIRQADPLANDYCLGMIVIELRPGARPSLVDVGGELIRVTGSNRNLQNFSSGEPETIVPHWSPDGEWIAYLRRDNGMTQVWRARADGSRAERVTYSTSDVLDLSWSPDGNAIIFSSRPSLGDELTKIEEEGKGGFVYDEQFWPVASAKPYPRGPISSAYFVVGLEDGRVRPATDAQRRLLDPAQREPSIPGAIRAASSGAGDRIAWTAAQHAEVYSSPSELRVRVGAREMLCVSERCRGSIVRLWWTANDTEVLFLRYEGPAGRSRLGLYRWNPAKRTEPAQIFVTNDMLVGCEMARAKLLCGRETSSGPRRVVLIDPATGAQQDLYDPNPEFSSLRFGEVTRLIWRNRFGAETFGDLVLPPDHRAGERHPLVIVQYRSRGFLRGGMGDEYPIFVFAAHGFAVLSIDRPADFADSLHLPDINAHTRANISDWADRKNVFASIESGIDRLDEMGLIDRERVGITGMSDGASTVQFALVNSTRFAAAAVSSCCEDPAPSFSSVGPAYRNDLLRWGYPRLRDDTRGFWRQFSLVLNADKIRTPLLMQLPDDEFRFSLEAFEELRSRSKPADLIVYPDEHHVKWQPAHRLAVYDIGIQWFDFWLRDRPPVTAREATRWCALAAASGKANSACKVVPAANPSFNVH